MVPRGCAAFAPFWDLSQNPGKPSFREDEAPAEPRVLLARTARQEPRPPAESLTCHLAKQLRTFDI